jgi:hypothetical protein
VDTVTDKDDLDEAQYDALCHAHKAVYKRIEESKPWDVAELHELTIVDGGFLPVVSALLFHAFLAFLFHHVATDEEDIKKLFLDYASDLWDDWAKQFPADPGGHKDIQRG